MSDIVVPNSLEPSSLARVLAARADFPALAPDVTVNGQPLVFFDSAASAQKPICVIEAISRFLSHGYANIHRGLYRYSQEGSEAFESVRKKIAAFINATSENEIVFTRNATESLNLLAQCFGAAHLKAGDEILLSAMEHHANIVPWQMAAQRSGALIRVIPLRPEELTLDLDAMERLITPRTKIVSFTHVSNALGIVNPVREIVSRARVLMHPQGIVVLDSSQGIVHCGLDVQAMGCDFVAFTGHKLYGPNGIGILWGREALLNTLPPYQGGGDMIEQVSFTSGTNYKAAPARFEAGTPAITEVLALGVAVDYVCALGYPAIAAHEAALLKTLMEELSMVEGVRIIGPQDTAHKAGIVSFTAAWGHVSDIAVLLDQCGVAVRSGHHCCMPLMESLGLLPAGTVRASLGLYSSEKDVELFIQSLIKVRKLLS